MTSSPGFPQSNGKVENAVKIAKSLIQKAIESSSDPYLALLDWRNTPTEGLDSSPAQRLFSTRTLLPTTSSLLQPEVPKDTLEKLKLRKAKQALYFNVGAKELTELNVGDSVRVKPLHTTKRNTPWAKARVQGKVDVRSYQIRTEDGRVYRRNRRHLYKKDSIQPEPTTDDAPTLPAIAPQSAPDTNDVAPTTLVQHQPDSPDILSKDQPQERIDCKTTRSGRVIKPPPSLLAKL